MPDRRNNNNLPPSPEPKAKSAYEVLGVSPRATDLEIKKAFRQLMQTTHQDKAGGAGLALATVISNAYSEIKDQESRDAYDQKNRMPFNDSSSSTSEPVEPVNETTERQREEILERELGLENIGHIDLTTLLGLRWARETYLTPTSKFALGFSFQIIEELKLTQFRSIISQAFPNGETNEQQRIYNQAAEVICNRAVSELWKEQYNGIKADLSDLAKKVSAGSEPLSYYDSDKQRIIQRFHVLRNSLPGEYRSRLGDKATIEIEEYWNWLISKAAIEGEGNAKFKDEEKQAEQLKHRQGTPLFDEYYLIQEIKFQEKNIDSATSLASWLAARRAEVQIKTEYWSEENQAKANKKLAEFSEKIKALWLDKRSRM